MGNERLSWGRRGGGGGGGGNSRREKMKEAATASAGCMSTLLNLFHFHHFRFASPHRNHSNSYPFLQEEAITATGLEAPRNSLELVMKQEENLNFPVGIKIKTSHGGISRLDDIYSQSNSPGTKTPSVVARLMGLDLLPESNPLRPSFSDDPSAAVHSLPETPRTSSSSRKSDVERHRLSLQITNKAENIFKDEFSLSGQKTVCRRGRFKKDDGGGDRRSFGLDITNTKRNSHPSKTDQNLSLHNPNKKNSKISSKNGKEGSPRSRISDKKLPHRAAAVDRASKSRREKVVRSGERKKSDPTLLRVKNGPSPLHTKLPRKMSQVSDALSSKTNTQLSNKPSQPYSTNGGASALHGGASRILKHAVDGYDAVSSQRSARKLIFQLVDELSGQVFASPLKLNRWVSPAGCFPVVEGLCKRIESFPAAKCVVLEDIDSLIERDLCESQSNGYRVEGEVVVCEIEGEIVEWLVHEAVAVMGGAAAEEQTEIGVCRVGL